MAFKALSVILAVTIASSTATYPPSSNYRNYIPVNGGWSSWTTWSSCDAACGEYSTQTRTRTCDNPTPARYGLPCVGEDTETKSCVGDQHCPVDGEWGYWNEWSDCSATCGTGEKTRTRLCDSPSPLHGGADCTGDAEETMTCDSGYECPVDGEWGYWGEWSDCSATCGSGEKSRTRQCDSPAPMHGGEDCDGDAEETMTCDSGYECPVDGEWGYWGEWSDCSATCGSGEKTRTRQCDSPAPMHGGADCDGDAEETMTCDSGYNCPVDGSWGSWGSWSTCTATCGGGEQMRTRSCDDPEPAYGGVPCYGNTKDKRVCNTDDCPSYYGY